ncbi:MAG TPA: hypothetical protein PLH94_11170 [Fimbriimonadaceae bacterium]|nr:hypothetical protein [Fimbriimonadaceae bacterium]
MDFTWIKLTIGAIATIGLYSVLYRENKFYRLIEHIYLGLAAGWSITALWTESLKSTWWDKMVGTPTASGQPGTPGYWAYILLLPIGLMAYFVFSRKNNWVSRIPIGIILGLWAGQQADAWSKKFLPQIAASMKPIIPNDAFIVPAGTGPTPGSLYVSQAVTNIIFLVTLLSVLSYFLFSFELKTRFMKGMTTTGRWLMMIGFGAIFGNTVMTRFTLLIDRMYFIWIEWLITGTFKM